MPEFVNPKYADAARTRFKSPTRLECMMQDHPKVLRPDARVGFATFPTTAFSPCKNSIEGALAKQLAGLAPQCALSAEMDFYAAACRRLQALGVSVAPPVPFKAGGITVPRWPGVVLSPAMAATSSTLAAAFPAPEKVSISARSFLVVQGAGRVTIHSLRLDGALVIDVAQGQHLHVHCGDVVNAGWEFQPLTAGASPDGKTEEASGVSACPAAGDAKQEEGEEEQAPVSAFLQIRGFHLVKKAQETEAMNVYGEHTSATVVFHAPAGKAVLGAGSKTTRARDEPSDGAADASAPAKPHS